MPEPDRGSGARLATLIAAYDLLLCDLYGTLHDEAGLFPVALDALRRCRAEGRAVVLVSNAAAGGEDVAGRLGLPRDAYDAILTSADVALTLMAERGASTALHVGSPADRAALEGRVAFADVERADAILCTSYPDADPGPTLGRALERGLDLICTNPDAELRANGRTLRFAGLVARLYRALGGRAIETGKPSPSIYAAALALGERALGRAAPPDRVLCVGDTVRLDVEGALASGLQALWIDRGTGETCAADRLAGRAPALLW